MIKEMGYNYHDVLTAIDIYINRYSSQFYHSGIEQLIRKDHFHLITRRLNFDINDLFHSTSHSKQAAIVPIEAMIKIVKDT